MSLIVDGTAGITYPNSTVQASAGVVLQVVQGTYATPQFSTTSTTYVATNLTATITPKFSTSKILAIVSAQMTNTTPGASAYSTIYRNSTNLGGGSQSSLQAYYSSSGYQYVSCVMEILDSPATTSATTYTVYLKASSNTAYLNDITSTNTIILMEIAG